MSEETVVAPPAWKWSDLGALAIWTGVGVGILVAIVWWLRSSLEGSSGSLSLWLTAGLYVWILVGMLLAARRRGGRAVFGFKPVRPMVWVILPAIFVLQEIGLVIVAAIVNAIYTAIYHAPFINPQSSAISEMVGGDIQNPVNLLSLLFVVAFLVPVVEELAFRGVLYPLMRRSMPVWIAVGLTALIFAATHAIPPLIPALFVVGLSITIMREYTGSVLPGIVLHMMQNGLSIILFAYLPTLEQMLKQMQQ